MGIQVAFYTRSYTDSHGRAPRGYGSWAFDFGGGVFFAPTGTYSEAKAWVKAVLTTFPLADLAPLTGLGITPELLERIERSRKFGCRCEVAVLP